MAGFVKRPPYVYLGINEWHDARDKSLSWVLPPYVYLGINEWHPIPYSSIYASLFRHTFTLASTSGTGTEDEIRRLLDEPPYVYLGINEWH